MPRAAFTPAERPAGGAWAALRRRSAQFTDAVRMALDALRGHRLRSALSMLGISIGIAAVVSIVALSDAARATVDTKLRGFLSGRLMVFRGNPRLGPGAQALPFRLQDIAALRAIPGVKSVAPELEMTVTARHDNRDGQMTLFGAAPGELPQHGVKLVEGRDLSELDLAQRTQFVVLNHKARDRLFAPNARVIGQTLFVGPLPFVVVGVATQGGGALDVSGDWRDQLYVPATTYADKIRGLAEIDRLNVYMEEGQPPQQVQAAAERVLKVMHGKEDFNFFSLDNEFRKIEQVTLVMKLVLAAIAGISLLVGGVGVMNIMLVAVSERTPEIGIRMAVGARQRDVQTQFLIEAVVLCAAGGLVGVALPWLAALAANAVQQQVQVIVSWAALAVAFGVASAIGIGFGFLPARQASRLSPVQALARE
jgi:macrolide transport system ATP-binding/permease protein